MGISAVSQVEQDGLHRLETFLAQDPDNQSLQSAVFEAALRFAEWDKARAQIDTGLQKSPDALVWKMREGDLLLAQKRFAEAREALEAIGLEGAPSKVSDVVLHNIAYSYLCEQNFAQAIAILEPRMTELEQASDSSIPDEEAQVGLYKLWLRSLHFSGDVERACAWAKAMDDTAKLSPRVAGIASLVALDASDAILAKKWARTALEAETKDSEKPEALVTWASLLLGNQDVSGAQQFAHRALEMNPREGRAWSVIGFAQLLAGALQDAQKTFATALESIPGHVGTWHGLGWAQLTAGAHEAALATFQHALALDRNFAESHGAMAVALIYGGDQATAKEHADRAQGLDKTSLSGHYARALLKGEVRDRQALQRLAKRLLGGREGPMGESMASWLGGTDSSR